MLTYRVGHGGAAGAKAMGAYLTMETLTPEPGSAAAYYLGEIPQRSRTVADEFGQPVLAGEPGYADALGMLVMAETRVRGTPEDISARDERSGQRLAAAATRADFVARDGPERDTVGAVARIRQDLPPEVSRALGLGAVQPLSQEALSHLLSGRRADGQEIEGRTKRSAGLSVAEVFGLPTKGRGCAPPSGEALDNVLAGKRADGAEPSHDGRALSDAVVAGARKRFLDIFEASKSRELTAEEKVNIGDGKMARGLKLTAHRWQSKVNARNERVTFIDFTLSVDKSVSVAWALAPTAAERGIIHNAHRDAVAATMAYIEQKLAHARRGDGGRNGTEPGKIAWLSFDHYTSRPTVDYERIDKEGKPYTDFATVPLKRADMQLHTHTIVPNVVVTESGHVGSIDLDQLQGITKQFGAVFQAYLAQNLRQHGVDVARDDRTGAARITSVPERIVRHFSKRTQEAEQTARDYAAARGLDWDTLSGDQKSAMMKAGADELRQAKDKRIDSEEPSDFARWQEQARDVGYSHRSVLRPDAIKPELQREQRIALAYDDTEKALAAVFAHKATISLDEAHEVAARGLINAGIEDPARDIASVMGVVSERGIVQDGEAAPVVFAQDDAVRGKARWSLTTGLVERQERELVNHAQTAAKDRTADLTPAAIQRAVDRFLERRPDIDRDGAQWTAQRAMMDRLAMGGRLSVGIGVAGAGKSTVLAALVDAWHEEGRGVFGATLAWRQTDTLLSAGIDPKHMAAMQPFLRRATQGKLELNDRSVVVVDELGLIGTKQLLELTRLQATHGFQLVMLGDPKQCAAIDAGPVIRLLERALGEDAIPEIVTSIRQKSQRELETTAMWREGRAAEALERKMEDGDLRLVAGPGRAVIDAAARHWQERRQALQPGQSLLVIAPTNTDAHDVGIAIREQRRQAGELGPDVITVGTRDPHTGTERALPLAVGDHIRLFTRVHDADNWKTVLGNNGDIVEVRGAGKDGLTVRNIATGAEGQATWKRLTPFDQHRPAVAYGYASTVHVSQSQTVTEAIFVMPGGSRQADARSAYVALSRHERRVSLIISEGAERRQIFSRKAIGSFEPIEARDVIKNVASNLSRQPVKTSALDLLAHSARVYRGAVRHLGAGMEPQERVRHAEFRVERLYAKLRLEMSHGVRRVAEIARSARDRLTHRHERTLGQGRGLGL